MRERQVLSNGFRIKFLSGERTEEETAGKVITVGLRDSLRNPCLIEYRTRFRSQRSLAEVAPLPDSASLHHATTVHRA